MPSDSQLHWLFNVGVSITYVTIRLIGLGPDGCIIRSGRFGLVRMGSGFGLVMLGYASIG